MTTHWKIPKPEWDKNSLKINGSEVGSIYKGEFDEWIARTVVGGYVAFYPCRTEAEARAHIEEKAMEALGAEECE